jgi:hypothetical protein
MERALRVGKYIYYVPRSPAGVGLLDRTGTGGVRAAYDEIRTVISLTPAA